MSAIRTTEELRDVSFILRNLLRVGLPAETVLNEAADMLPAFAEPLRQGAMRIGSHGVTITQALEPLFPETVLPAIRAGEESGSIDRVMEQVWQSAKTQLEINEVTKKLRTPAILILAGIVVSLGFFLFLIPFMYGSMSRSVPSSFDPGLLIRSAVDANAFIMANPETVGISVAAVIMFVLFMFTRESFREAVSDLVVKIVIFIKPIGRAYAKLKFGVMAQYLQIVSMAGMDATKRIDLVMDTLPEPLQPGLRAFRAEMLSVGLATASRGKESNLDDPRHSEVLWPSYIRLAFTQASETEWVTPMREFGEVMIHDGKERLELQIKQLNLIAMMAVGLMIIVPVGMLYATMGKILSISMQMM